MMPSMQRNVKPIPAGWTLYAALFITILGVYLFLSPAHFLTTPDEEINLRTTLSLLEGNWGAIPSLEGFATKTGQDGQQYAQYGLGLPISALPWCAVGKWLDPSENAEKNSLAAAMDGNRVGTEFLRWWMTVFTMVITTLTVLLVFHFLLAWEMPLPRAMFMALVAGFCTYMWPHGRTFFTEPLTALCLLAAAWAIWKAHHSERVYLWSLLAGCFWAYAFFTRVDTVFTAPAAFWFLLSEEREGRIRFRFHLGQIVAFSVPFLLALSAVLGYNEFRFGSPFATGYEDQPEKVRFITPLLVGLHGFLLSTGRSVFVYSPPLLFAIVGFLYMYRRERWYAIFLYLLTACFLAAMAKWQNWAGGYDWGPRHIYQLTPFLMLFAAVSFLQRSIMDQPKWRLVWFALILVSLFVQFLGLGADAVAVIKAMLYQWAKAYPQVNVDLFFMQFTIYLPHFSQPVLHWNWISKYGADLLILKRTSNLALGHAIPLLMACAGGAWLWKMTLGWGKSE